MNPMLGAAAMSLSSFCVVTNALRLNLFDLHSAVRDKRIKNAVTQPSVTDEINRRLKEETEMKEKTMKIEGMMCTHCEATVKKALEKLEGVEEAIVSHEAGTAVVKLSADVEDAVLKQAVEDKDYDVLEIA